jgi:hypothetical protein
MRRNQCRFLLMLMLVAVALGFIPSAIAQEDRSVYISSIHSEGFPEISLKVRIIDSQGRVSSSLTNRDIIIYENGIPSTNFKVSSQETGPAYVVFVFDQGLYSNLDAFGSDRIRDLLLEFQKNYMRDGFDTVAIMERVNRGIDTTHVLLEPTQSAEEFIEAVQKLSFHATSQTQGLKAVESAFTTLVELLHNKPPRASTAIIYISRLVESPNEAQALKDTQTLEVKLGQNNVHVYTWHTDRNGDHSNVLKALAASSGGQYVFLQHNQDNLPAVRSVYAEIMEQSRVFLVEYRSTSGASGLRSIAVVPAGGTIDAAKDKRDFSIKVSDPRVSIVSPENRALFKRNAVMVEGSEEMVYDLNSITVTANLDPWEDGFQRRIVLAELLVDQQPRMKIMPDQSATRFEFTLDITNMVISGTHSVPVQVRVQDELGREGISSSVVPDIQVIKPEPIVVISTTTVTTFISACEEDAMGAQCWLQRLTLALPWVGLTATGVLLYLTRRQVTQLASSAGKAVKEGAGELRKTLLGGSGGPKKGRQLATLHVIVGGKGRYGGEIKIYNLITTLGRDPARSDFQLFDEDEKSTVSGCHCTIMYDQGHFWLTDNNSTNGTQLNGINIIANEPYPLKDGDEIVLGDVFNTGAKLRFELVGDGKPNHEADNGIAAQKVTWGISVDRGKTELDLDAEEDDWNKPNIGSKTELDMEMEKSTWDDSQTCSRTELDNDLDDAKEETSTAGKGSDKNGWRAGGKASTSDIDIDDFDQAHPSNISPKSASTKSSDDWLKELD